MYIIRLLKVLADHLWWIIYVTYFENGADSRPLFSLLHFDHAICTVLLQIIVHSLCGVLFLKCSLTRLNKIINE